MLIVVQEIDAYINKASDQGYTAILNLGSKGLNYASNIVLTTALKVCHPNSKVMRFIQKRKGENCAS